MHSSVGPWPSKLQLPHGMPVPFLAQVAGNPGSQEGLAETPYRGRGGTMIQNPLGCSWAHLYESLR